MGLNDTLNGLLRTYFGFVTCHEPLQTVRIKHNYTLTVENNHQMLSVIKTELRVTGIEITAF